jgi:hypothetical protein
MLDCTAAESCSVSCERCERAQAERVDGYSPRCQSLPVGGHAVGPGRRTHRPGRLGGHCRIRKHPRLVGQSLAIFRKCYRKRIAALLMRAKVEALRAVKVMKV